MIHRSWRIVFMGTPAFAVPSLQFLMEAGYPIVSVITAPDKPGGRGMKQMISSPVKKFALDHGLHVLQPANLKSRSFLEELRSLKADFQVVVAFRMLPEVVWNMPEHGTMNLHGSLLPAYRGAAPIQWAVIRGEVMTGVTTFLLQHSIDTGNILQQTSIPVLTDDTTGTLHDRMMHRGAGLVLSSVDGLCLGNIRPTPQDESKSSHAPKIHHEDGRINWAKPAQEVYNLIRGMAPNPGAWTLLDQQEWKIWRSTLKENHRAGSPGKMRVEGKSILVECRNGELELLEVQLSGKRRMTAREFINGYSVKDWLLT